MKTIFKPGTDYHTLVSAVLKRYKELHQGKVTVSKDTTSDAKTILVSFLEKSDEWTEYSDTKKWNEFSKNIYYLLLNSEDGEVNLHKALIFKKMELDKTVSCEGVAFSFVIMCTLWKECVGKTTLVAPLKRWFRLENIRFYKTWDEKMEKDSPILEEYKSSVDLDILSNLDVEKQEKEKTKEYKGRCSVFPLKRLLDKYICGQESAKRAVALAVSEHVRRSKEKRQYEKKTNILLAGPSGSGKTYMFDILRKYGNLGVPIVVRDVSNKTGSAFKGEGFEEVFQPLKMLENYEWTILFLDEFDKLCKPNYDSTGDNVNFHTLSEILTVLEGGSTYGVKTENMLIVLGGAFTGIEKAREIKRTIGFAKTEEEEMEPGNMFDVVDLIEYGMPLEIAGRISNIVSLNPLTKEDLYQIITKAKDNAIEFHKKYLKTEYDIELEFDEDALWELVNLAGKLPFGARSIRSLIDNKMVDWKYEALEQNAAAIRITKEAIRGQQKPIYKTVKASK